MGETVVESFDAVGIAGKGVAGAVGVVHMHDAAAVRDGDYVGAADVVVLVVVVIGVDAVVELVAVVLVELVGLAVVLVVGDAVAVADVVETVVVRLSSSLSSRHCHAEHLGQEVIGF